LRRSGGNGRLLARTGIDQRWPAGLYPAQPATVRPSGNPYGDAAGRDWPDNDVRFGRFASAAAQLAAGTLDQNWAADLVHANDWQAALVPAYLAWNAIRIPTILTIHNLAYQGLFPRESLRRIGAPEHSFHIEGLEFYDKLSFLKGGIVYASHLTTVSETYAREITDYVRQQFGLALARGPIFGLVARLVHQKGVDLVLSVADKIIEAGGQIVAIGSGEPEIEQAALYRKAVSP
jgi:starch synthase